MCVPVSTNTCVCCFAKQCLCVAKLCFYIYVCCMSNPIHTLVGLSLLLVLKCSRVCYEAFWGPSVLGTCKTS